MDGFEAKTFEYDCCLINSKLQALLRTLIHVADPDRVFKILKISVVRQDHYELLNNISFQTNLSIDELAYHCNLAFSEIKYATKTRANRKNNKRQHWMNMQRNPKNNYYLKSILQISKLYEQFDEENFIDLLNVERASYHNFEITQIVYQNYFSKLFLDKHEFNLNEFLVKCNLTNICILDFEAVLRKIGEIITRFVIDNYESLIIIEFYVREKLNLILVMIARLCPNVTEIVIDEEQYFKPWLPIVPQSFSTPNLGASISLYFQADEIESFLFQLFDKTDIIFSVKKVSNIRILCDSKSVKKLLTLDLYSMRYKLINFLADYFQSTYQTKDFINYQFAFPWHCEHYKAWKNIVIHKKNALQYLFNQTNIRSYFNLFDLIRIEAAFFDLNLDFSFYPYSALKEQIIRSQKGNELNLYEIVKRFKLQKIQFEDFIKMLRIYGKFVKRFVGSEYLVEIPKFQRNKLKKIIFHIYKYCKNVNTIVMDGIRLRNLNKKSEILKINDATNKNFNYEISNKSKKGISEIVKILNENEMFVEAINVQDYENFNEFIFLKILELPFLAKLTLSTYYRNFVNWDIEHLKIGKFSLQPDFLVILCNDKHDFSLAGQFITNFVKFLFNHNFNKFVKLQILCYDCEFENLLVFNESLINAAGFGRMQFSYQHMAELSRCKNLDFISFYDCQLLNDDLLLKLAIDLEEWGRLVEIKVESCFITDAFFYRFAEYQIHKGERRNYRFYGNALTKFVFIDCHIKIDWENSYFVLNETGEYIYIEESDDSKVKQLDVCDDYDFYN